MCDFTKGFKLCSCEPEKIKFREKEVYKKSDGQLIPVKNKKNDSIPLIYIWQLFRLVGEYKNSSMLGRYILPTDTVGNGLDAEWIALNLNSENCFDFEYDPQEGDTLFIRQNVILGPYISLLYKDGQWIIDHYSPFEFEIKELKEGLIREIS
ncbi:hypothetical protein [Flavobacterium cerinum]|uniref:YopX protein domain-containing protein n=1 Tax=Flavobacterium cerinum TaxID=2502784 RepID=A0ABY5IT44_9FLAO|nr:hypothetical protein [Flavobacterium cerinum]UUC45969.1 hypothetical protein NOX80_01910 [Flavobacterium cerinum]